MATGSHDSRQGPPRLRHCAGSTRHASWSCVRGVCASFCGAWPATTDIFLSALGTDSLLVKAMLGENPPLRY